jgi:hypothetical protein
VFEIGSSLREARLRQGLDFPELEQATKIRGKYLRALEEEQFHVLPAQTYVKGFLRSYAEELGLDGQLYVDEYNSRYVTGEEEPPARPRRSSARPRHGGQGLEANVVLLAVAGIAVVTALIIAAWKFGSGNSEQSIPNLGKQPPAVRHAAVKAKKKHVHKRPRRTHLIIRAVNGGSFLQIHYRSPTGPSRYTGTLEPGPGLPFFRLPIWINAGSPEHLVFILNGRRLPFAAATRPQTLLVTAKGVRPAPSGI